MHQWSFGLSWQRIEGARRRRGDGLKVEVAGGGLVELGGGPAGRHGRGTRGQRSLALRVVTARAREHGGRKTLSPSFLGVRKAAQRGGGDGQRGRKEAEAQGCSARRSKRRGGAGGRHSGVDER